MLMRAQNNVSIMTITVNGFVITSILLMPTTSQKIRYRQNQSYEDADRRGYTE